MEGPWWVGWWWRLVPVGWWWQLKAWWWEAACPFVGWDWVAEHRISVPVWVPERMWVGAGKIKLGGKGICCRVPSIPSLSKSSRIEMYFLSSFFSFLELGMGGCAFRFNVPSRAVHWEKCKVSEVLGLLEMSVRTRSFGGGDSRTRI